MHTKEKMSRGGTGFPAGLKVQRPDHMLPQNIWFIYLTEGEHETIVVRYESDCPCHGPHGKFSGGSVLSISAKINELITVRRD